VETVAQMTDLRLIFLRLLGLLYALAQVF